MTKLSELKAAYEAATSGEWLSKDDHAPNMAAVGTGVAGWLGLAQMFGDTQKEANSNAQFIALAHNNMPALLEAVELLNNVSIARAHQSHSFDVDGWYVQVRSLLENLK